MYFSEADAAWYAVTNQDKGVGFGMVWDIKVFPYLWMWQVCHGSYEYPWYGRTYNMALEPVTSPPERGINSAVKDQTALLVNPGERVTSFTNAIVYTGGGRLARLEASGAVDWK